MLVDVSHCGPATTLDAIAQSKAAGRHHHSSCKALYDTRGADRTRSAGDGRPGCVIGIFPDQSLPRPEGANTLDDSAPRRSRGEGRGDRSRRDRQRPRAPADSRHRGEKQKLIAELSRLRPVTAANFRWPFFIGRPEPSAANGDHRRRSGRRGYKPAAVDKILGMNFYRLFRETIG